MGIFAASSPFDQYVERATSEKNTGEDWALIMDVCDRAKDNSSGPKDCLKSISKRLNHDNPRVALQTITLLDACINNCGRKFLLEVAGREFEQELGKQCTSARTHPKVASRLRESVKQWAEGEFKGDPELGLIPSLYSKLVKEGYDFESDSDAPKKTVTYSTDPNVVNNKQEEDDIAKAIQLSLQLSDSNKAVQNLTPSNSTSLYGQASAVLSSKDSLVPEKELLKVRAIYDFEAAEDNELTFKSGEIILVSDHSDPNWWKGSNHRGEGLFPVNFVSKNLEDEEETKSETTTKRVSFSESVEVTEVSEDGALDAAEEPTGEINEDKIDQLVHLLHEADPTGERGDHPSLPMLEEQVNSMAPSIDTELERIDRKNAQLTMISKDLVGALNLYHQLMRDMPPAMSYYAPQFNKGGQPPVGAPPMHNMMPNQFLPSSPQQMPPQSVAYSQYAPNFAGGPMHPYMPQPPMTSAATPGAPANYQPSQPVRMEGNTVPTHSQFPPHDYGKPPTDPSVTVGMVAPPQVTNAGMMAGPPGPHQQGPPTSGMPPPVTMQGGPQNSHMMPPHGPGQVAPPMGGQIPPQNMAGQAPPPMMSQGQPPNAHPPAMPFYSQPPTYQSMQQQQPLL